MQKLAKKDSSSAKKIILAALGMGGAGTVVGLGGLGAYMLYKHHKNQTNNPPQGEPISDPNEQQPTDDVPVPLPAPSDATEILRPASATPVDIEPPLEPAAVETEEEKREREDQQLNDAIRELTRKFNTIRMQTREPNEIDEYIRALCGLISNNDYDTKRNEYNSYLETYNQLESEIQNKDDIIKRNFKGYLPSLNYNEKEIISTLADQLSKCLGKDLSNFVEVPLSWGSSCLYDNRLYMNYACCAVNNYFLGSGNPKADLLGSVEFIKCKSLPKNYFEQTTPFNMFNRLVISLGFANLDEENLRKAKECVEILRNSLNELDKRCHVYIDRRKDVYNNTLLSTDNIDLLQTTIRKDDTPFDWDKFNENTDIYGHFAYLLKFLKDLINCLPGVYSESDCQNFTVKISKNEYTLKGLFQNNPSPLPYHDNSSAWHKLLCTLCINDDKKTEIPFSVGCQNYLHFLRNNITTRSLRDLLERVYGNVDLTIGVSSQDALDNLQNLTNIASENNLLRVNEITYDKSCEKSVDYALKLLINEIWKQNISANEIVYDCSIELKKLIHLFVAGAAIKGNEFDETKKQHLMEFMEELKDYYDSSSDKNLVSEFIQAMWDSDKVDKKHISQIYHSAYNRRNQSSATPKAEQLIGELEKLGIDVPD